MLKSPRKSGGITNTAPLVLWYNGIEYDTCLFEQNSSKLVILKQRIFGPQTFDFFVILSSQKFSIRKEVTEKQRDFHGSGRSNLCHGIVQKGRFHRFHRIQWLTIRNSGINDVPQFRHPPPNLLLLLGNDMLYYSIKRWTIQRRNCLKIIDDHGGLRGSALSLTLSFDDLILTVRGRIFDPDGIQSSFLKCILYNEEMVW